MANLSQDSSGGSDCNKLIISMWAYIPTPAGDLSQSNFSLLEFGGYPDTQQTNYYPTHWNDIGTYGFYTANVPPADAQRSDSPTGYWVETVNVGGDTWNVVGNDAIRGITQAGTVQQSPGGQSGGTAQWADQHLPPGPFLLDIDFVNQWWDEASYAIRWTQPWVYYTTNRTFGDLHSSIGNYNPDGSPWLGPIYNWDTSNIWEPGWTAFTPPITLRYGYATSRIVVSSTSIYCQIGGAVKLFPSNNGVDGFSIVPYIWNSSANPWESFSYDKWHHILIVADLQGDEMIGTTGTAPDTSKPNTFYMLLDGIPTAASGTFVNGYYYAYEQQYKQLDTDPSYTGPYTTLTSPPGSGIIVKNYPVCLPYNPKADRNSDTAPSDNNDYPTPAKRRYAQVQIWFGKSIDPTISDKLKLFLDITRNTDNALVGNIPALDQDAIDAYASAGIDVLSLAASPNNLGAPDVYLAGGPDDFIDDKGTDGAFKKIGTIVSVPGPKNIPIDGNHAIIPPGI